MNRQVKPNQFLVILNTAKANSGGLTQKFCSAQVKVFISHAVDSGKVHNFWEGHKILQNLHRKFDRYNIGQI